MGEQKKFIATFFKFFIPLWHVCVYMINCEFDFAIFAKRQTNIFQDDASACIKCTLKMCKRLKKNENVIKTKFMEKFFHTILLLLKLNFRSFILIFIEKKISYLMCSFLMSKLL